MREYLLSGAAGFLLAAAVFFGIGKEPSALAPDAFSPGEDVVKCPAGWVRSPANDPYAAAPDGQQFYTCARDGFEVTVWQSGIYTGYGPDGKPLADPKSHLK